MYIFSLNVSTSRVKIVKISTGMKGRKMKEIFKYRKKKKKKGDESTKIRWQEEVKYNHDQREKFPGMGSRPSKCVKAKTPVHK